MRKALTFVAAGAAVVAGAAVLQLKLAVQEKADEVDLLARQIREDREAIRVLEAEWAYLTTPASLQDRSVDFLALMPPMARQVLVDPSVIPMRPNGLSADEDPGVLLKSAYKKPEDKSAKKNKVNRDKGL